MIDDAADPIIQQEIRVQISPRALRQMASDVDDMHRDSMKTFREEVADLNFGDQLRAGRRSFIKKAALGGAAIGFGSALVPVSRLLPVAGAQELSDTDIAAFAQSVELAAVAAYQAGAPLVTDEVLPIAQLFAQHHQEHADAFGALAGDAAVDGPNQALLDALAPTLGGLAGQADVLRFARDVENQAVATYAFALTALESPAAAAGTATILPVESAHAAALGVALGQAPADQFPNGAFESADISRGIDPAQFPVQS